jgi:hypothetical protein
MVAHIPPSTIQQITPSLRAFSSLSPVSEIVASLDESIKSNLEKVRDWYFWLLVISTVVVFVGVVLEEAEGWMSYLKSVLPLQPITEYRLTKKLATLGWIFICAGVMGEGVFEVLVAKADSAIHSFDEALLDEARKEAGSAAKSAKTAHEEADAVDRESKDLKTRLDAASRQLADAEQDILAEGPRWRILKRGEDEFIKSLKPFAGQRLTVVICGNENTEQWQFEQLLMDMLRKAKWDAPGYTNWAGCPNMLGAGNLMYFVATTDDSPEWAGLPPQQWLKVNCGRFNISHDAFNTLCDALYRLRIVTSAFRERPLPKEVGVQNARSFFGFNVPNGPAEMAYTDPGRVFILIGAAEPIFQDEKKANKSAKRKKP